MPRTPEVRQSVLDFLLSHAYKGTVSMPIQHMARRWQSEHPEYTTSDRAFRQIVYKLRQDGYIAYESPGHKVSPIRIVRTRVALACPVNGNHVYICACGKKSRHGGQDAASRSHPAEAPDTEASLVSQAASGG